VRFEIDQVRALTHCHCANCRKLTGAAFATYAHVDADKFRFVAGEDMTVAYESAPGSFRHRCKTCGCATHFAVAADGFIFGVNARMMAGLDPAKITIRQMDNSHSGFFWTRSDGPVLASHHPPMPPPTFDDWR